MAGKADAGEAPFTEEQESRLGEIIAQALKAGDGKGAPKPEGGDGKPAPSDDEWAAMGPRQRESWVHDAVVGQLEQIRQGERVDSLEDDVADLRSSRPRQSEKPPAAWSWLTTFLWGKPSDSEDA